MSSSEQNKENLNQENEEHSQQQEQKSSSNDSVIEQKPQEKSQVQAPSAKLLRFSTQNYEYQFYLKNQIIKCEVDILDNGQISMRYLEGYLNNDKFANITNPCFQNTKQAMDYIQTMYYQTTTKQFLQDKLKIKFMQQMTIQKNQKIDAKMTITVFKSTNGVNTKRFITLNLIQKSIAEVERDKRVKQKSLLIIQMLKNKLQKQRVEHQKQKKESQDKHRTVVKQLIDNMVGTKKMTPQAANKYKNQEELQNQSQNDHLKKYQKQESEYNRSNFEEQSKHSIYDYRSQIFSAKNYKNSLLKEQSLQQPQVDMYTYTKKEHKQKKRKNKQKKKDKKKSRMPLQSKMQQFSQINKLVDGSVDSPNLSQINNYIQKLKRMHLQQFSEEYISPKNKQSSSSSSSQSDQQKQIIYDSNLVAQLKRQLQQEIQQQKKKNKKKRKKQKKKQKKIKKEKKNKKKKKKKKHKHKSKKNKKIYDSSSDQDQDQVPKRKMQNSQVPSVGSNFFKYLSEDLQENNEINNHHLVQYPSYQFSDYHTPVANLGHSSNELKPLRAIKSRNPSSVAPSANPIYRPANSIFAKTQPQNPQNQNQIIQIIKIPIQFMKDIAPYSNFQFSGNRITKRGGYGCQQVIINFPIPRIGRYSISATVIQSRKLYFWFGVIDIRQRDRTETYTYANSICFSFRTGVIVASRKWQRQRTGRLKIGQTVKMEIDMSNHNVSWHVNDGKVAIVQMPKKMRKMILVPYFQVMEIGDIIEFS